MKEYRNEQGQLHRLDGPAVIYEDGGQEWWADGLLHRTDGPAIVRADGGQVWWFEGRPHRLDGPAVIRADGTTEWWVHSKQVDQLTVMLLKQSARTEV